MALSLTVAPKNPGKIVMLGSDESGKLEIEKKGFITVGEQAFMAQAEVGDESVGRVMKLARKVAKHYKTDLMTAYEATTATITGQRSKIELNEKFLDEAQGITTELVAAESRKNVMKAWCLLLYRVDSDITADEVMELHPVLLKDLLDLYDEEESGSVKSLQGVLGEGGTTDETEDLAKK